MSTNLQNELFRLNQLITAHGINVETAKLALTKINNQLQLVLMEHNDAKDKLNEAIQLRQFRCSSSDKHLSEQKVSPKNNPLFYLSDQISSLTKELKDKDNKITIQQQRFSAANKKFHTAQKKLNNLKNKARKTKEAIKKEEDQYKNSIAP